MCATMHQLTPHRLWIGNARDGRNFRTLFDQGIEAIVQLAIEEEPLQPPRDLIVLRFPLIDGAANNPHVLYRHTVIGGACGAQRTDARMLWGWNEPFSGDRRRSRIAGRSRGR